MTKRLVRLWAFGSIKGGVGKSTLAVTTARLLAGAGGGVVVADCDLTGTSLADNLRLCAPRVSIAAGDQRSDLSEKDGDAGAFYDSEETHRLRAQRRDAGPTDPSALVYLNDLLRARPPENLATALWRSPGDDGVGYLPSSSLHRDVRASLEWLSREPFEWIHRFSLVLDALLTQVPTTTDVVIDLPPGTWGFAHQALVLVSALSRDEALPSGFPVWGEEGVKVITRPFLIMSQDRGDLLPSLEYFTRHALVERLLPTLVPVVNRANLSTETIRSMAADLLGPGVSSLRAHERLVVVDELRTTLGRVFLDDGVAIDGNVRAVGRSLGIPESR